MSSKRWNKKEKAELIKLYSNGTELNDIAKKLNRSESAIRLRLQSIIYDGIAKGMKVSDLEAILGKDASTIIQMFYAHREFKESRGEDVINLGDVSKILTGSSKKKSSKVNKASKSKSLDELIGDELIGDDGSNSSKTRTKSQSSEIVSLMEQNRIMEAIINNRELKKKIKKLYKEGKLNEEEKRVLERILRD